MGEGLEGPQRPQGPCSPRVKDASGGSHLNAGGRGQFGGAQAGGTGSRSWGVASGDQRTARRPTAGEAACDVGGVQQPLAPAALGSPAAEGGCILSYTYSSNIVLWCGMLCCAVLCCAVL